MIQDFSQGYYYLSMDVQQYDGGPVIQNRLHRFIQSELFGKDSPVMMRVGFDGGKTFGVDSEGAIPSDVLALPPSLVNDTGKSDVFILKPEYTDTVGDYDG